MAPSRRRSRHPLTRSPDGENPTAERWSIQECAPLLLMACAILALTAPLSSLQASSSVEPQQALNRWSCFSTTEAQARKQRVEHGMLPHVVFSDETTPSDIESRMRALRSPALSVAVIHDGRLDWTAAWGRLSNDGAPADCGALFQAGSLAKPLTLLAALRMQQQDVLDLDRPIETYLRSYELPAGQQSASNPVTLRNLLAHTAGITPGGYAGYAISEPMPSIEQVARADAPSNSPKVEVLAIPDSTLRYSGGGYTVVQIALQDQLDAPFEQIMREWLIGPLGMREADFAQPLAAINQPRAASGHKSDGSAVPGGWHNYPEQAAAGLWATPSDLAQVLLEMHKAYKGQSSVLAKASMEGLLSKPVDGSSYGFRRMVAEDQLFVTHYGGTVGYNAGMTLNLDTGEGAVYLTNSENTHLGPEFLSAVARVYGWPIFREEKVTRASRPEEMLAPFSGDYVFPEQGWKVSVVFEQGMLTLVFPNADRYALVPIEGGEHDFIHADSGVRASFERKADDLLINLYGQTGKRTPPAELP